MKYLVLLALLLGQIATYPPDYGDMSKKPKKGKGPGVGKTPKPPNSNCGCGTAELFAEAQGYCEGLEPPGSIQPTCLVPDYMIYTCEPGGVDPPQPVAILWIDRDNKQCQGSFAEYIRGEANRTFFDTGGWISMKVPKQSDACWQEVLDTGFCQ